MRRFIYILILLKLGCVLLISQDSSQPVSNFLYMSNSEHSGGGPFCFDEYGNRNTGYWGGSDIVTGNVVLTNGELNGSTYGCAEFYCSIWMTYGTEIDIGVCGTPDTLTVPPFSFIPDSYQNLKVSANYVFDATSKLAWDGVMNRDTLIMTELYFQETGFNVKQWWFLKPPHLSANNGLPLDDVSPTDLEWVSYSGDWLSWCEDTEDPIDLRTCSPYTDSLHYFHAQMTNLSDGEWVNESLLDSTVSGSHGFSHFDYQPINSVTGEFDSTAYLIDNYYDCPTPTVIYIQGGPVRVSGTYSGNFTVVTDDYIAYKRHAWPTPVELYGDPPIDTVWCNIWLTDDLINSDASMQGSLENVQPDGSCQGGSSNSMGLVSGANVVIANTRANGGCDSMWGTDVNINAAIVALNESFVIHYWQNTLTNPYSWPPLADGRGSDKFWCGSGYSDYRGQINLWGSIYQTYRGYTNRNTPGPYAVSALGMTKNYNYDYNLQCNSPPLFPEFDFVYPFLGDLNHDRVIDIQDIILILNYIIVTQDDQLFYFADLNQDSSINILDIMITIQIILDNP